MRILLDQNIPRNIKVFFKNNYPEWEVYHTSDLGLSEDTDKVIFRKAIEMKAVILTFDEDFSDIRLFTEPGTGIIRLNIWPTTIEEIAQALERLFIQVESNDIVGSLIIIDNTKIRIRKSRRESS